MHLLESSARTLARYVIRDASGAASWACWWTEPAAVEPQRLQASLPERAVPPGPTPPEGCARGACANRGGTRQGRRALAQLGQTAAAAASPPWLARRQTALAGRPAARRNWPGARTGRPQTAWTSLRGRVLQPGPGTSRARGKTPKMQAICRRTVVPAQPRGLSPATAFHRGQGPVGIACCARVRHRTGRLGGSGSGPLETGLIRDIRLFTATGWICAGWELARLRAFQAQTNLAARRAAAGTSIRQAYSSPTIERQAP